MQNIIVKRYNNPNAVGWAGWIEPEDKSWIAFIALDGSPRFFLQRDAVTGACLPDDPDDRAKFLVSFGELQAREEAYAGPVEGIHYPILTGRPFIQDCPAPPNPRSLNWGGNTPDNDPKWGAPSRSIG